MVWATHMPVSMIGQARMKECHDCMTHLVQSELVHPTALCSSSITFNNELRREHADDDAYLPNDAWLVLRAILVGAAL